MSDSKILSVLLVLLGAGPRGHLGSMRVAYIVNQRRADNQPVTEDDLSVAMYGQQHEDPAGDERVMALFDQAMAE